MTSPILLETKDLRRYYSMGKAVIRALDGVSLNIARGEFVAVMGPSGSGKSTLLHLAGGLESPSSGTIEVEGQSIGALSERDRAWYRNRKLGFVFQNFQLLNHRTALENVELPLKIQDVSRRERKARCQALLERLGLGERLHHLPGELSGGERQRVAIARALVSNPVLVLADEPTGNLDSATGQEILRLFREFNEERTLTVLMVTHDLSIASQAHRRIPMRDGRIAE